MFPQPSDGYAYNKNELEALATLPAPSADAIVSDLAKTYEFHQRSIARSFPPVAGLTDEDAIRIIERAVLAEYNDPDPVIEEDDVAKFDWVNREGQWPPSQSL